MGIYDRPYARADGGARPTGPGPGPGRVLRMGMWSITTWIIVACVGVYVIDGFLPMRLVPMSGPILAPGVPSLPADAVRSGRPQAYEVVVGERDGEPVYRRGFGQPVLAHPGGPPIGWQEVQPMHLLQSWLHFSTQRGFFRVEFWRLIGFQFLHDHGSISHLLFNMIGLFFFGPLAEQYLGRKRYLAFYLLCGIFGALMYVLLNLLGLAAAAMGLGQVPFLLINSPYTPLIGASAGVYGVIMAGAFLAPNATVLLFLIVPMRLVTLAYILVGVAFFVLLTSGTNAGGQAGHIGGALAGYYFIRHPRHLHGFFDILGRVDPTSRSRRGRPSRRAEAAPRRPSEIDRILEKISRDGIQSLTAREKRMLRDASEEP